MDCGCRCGHLYSRSFLRGLGAGRRPIIDESSEPMHDSQSRGCPNCSHDNSQAAPSPYSCNSWHIKECTNCGFVYLENVLAYDELVTNHAWSKSYSQAKRQRQRKYPVIAGLGAVVKQLQYGLRTILRRNKVQQLVSQFVQQGRLLDVGCGYGAALRELPAEVTPFGIEIEAEMAAMADEHARQRGGQVLQADALSGLGQFAADYFDGLILQSFLEHEVQPVPMLEQCARVLAPGSHLIIKVPNYACWNRRLSGQRWCGFRFPDHVNYFTPRSLAQMLRRTHLLPVRCSILDRLPTSDSLWMVAQRKQAARSSCTPLLPTRARRAA